jgi:hypothetical protein
MRSSLPRMLSTTHFFVAIGDRRQRRSPLIAAFRFFPRLRLATFQSHVRTRLSGPAEADLIPRPWV